MRIIKFRGLRCGYRKEWDKEKGWVELNGWVYGSLINNMWVYNGTTYEKGTPVCEIITGDTDEDNWQDAIDDLSNTIKVKTESIGQFTGLQDKNGVDIYEGDIVSHAKESSMSSKCTMIGKDIVTWDRYNCKFILGVGDTWGMIYKKYEIIGNIHQSK